MNSPVSPRRVTDPRPGGPIRRSRRWWWIVAAVVVVVAGVALALFEPWRLFTRSSLDEAAPVAAAASTPIAGASASASVPAVGGSSSPSAAPATSTAGGAAPGTPTSAAGTTSSAAPSTDTGQEPSAAAAPPPTPFVDGEHPTSGTAAVVQAADGRRYVRLENFSTSDGPDVHVILSDRNSGQADWGVYDDGRWVELGELKATDGNQNYEIPADVDLAGLQSVVIWCDRFDVAFGTAPLAG